MRSYPGVGLAKRTYWQLRRRLSLGANQRLAPLIERIYGVNVSGYITEQELGHTSPEDNAYGPSGWRVLSIALKDEEFANDVFVDFGSGKGQVVVQAGKLPFKRVVGVEISKELDRVAQENIRRNKRRFKCNDVSNVCEDVRTFQIPADLTIAFLANPFVGEVFRDVIARIRQVSLDGQHSVRLIYGHPILEADILALGFRMIKPAYGGEVRMYQFDPPRRQAEEVRAPAPRS